MKIILSKWVTDDLYSKIFRKFKVALNSTEFFKTLPKIAPCAYQMLIT